MWPLLVAAGVYLVCKGIQDGIDENRDASRRQLPYDNDRHSGLIGYDEDLDADLLEERHDREVRRGRK